MKRFRFRLASLLRYRQYLERKAQLEVARVRSDIVACDRRIGQLKNDFEAAGRRLETEAETGVDAVRYLLFTNYLSGIDSFIEAENERRKRFLKELAKKQKILAERSMEKKILENLEERKKEAYYHEMLTAERKEADDTIILRKARDMDR